MALTKKLPAVFYGTKLGGRPVREFLTELPREDRRIIGEHIATVEYGWPIGSQRVPQLALDFGKYEAAFRANVLPGYSLRSTKDRWCCYMAS